MANVPRRGSASMNELTSIINAYFHEFTVTSEAGSGVSFGRFCHFLAHGQLFTSCFDHIDALQVFVEHASTEDTPMLDQNGFQSALKAIAKRFHGAGAEESAVVRMSKDAHSLGELIRDINLVRTSGFDPKTASVHRTTMYVPEVVQAAYTYSTALRHLFRHYATDIGGQPAPNVPWDSIAKPRSKDMCAVSGRSAYHFCHATKLVPHTVVAGELMEIARSMLPATPTAAEQRYFEDQAMTVTGDDRTFLEPNRSARDGEPRFDFAGLVELLVGVALSAPPRCWKERPEVRAQRVHDVFTNTLELPQDDTAEANEFDASSHLQDLSDEARREKAMGNAAKAGSAMGAIFAQLHMELPMLPPPNVPKVPEPPPNTKLQPQPLSATEAVEKLRKLVAEQKALKALKPSQQKKKPFDPKKEAAARQKILEDMKPHGPTNWNQITWFAKRPEATAEPSGPPRELLESAVVKRRPPIKNPRNLPPAHQRHDMRYQQMELMRDQMLQSKRVIRQIGEPVGGWGVGVTLIDEPLLAPRCPENEQVSTTVETALASRRLRNYDVAISLLIRARRMWAVLAAGKEQMPLWSDVQPLVPTPSPWDAEPFAGRSAEDTQLVEVTVFPEDGQNDNSNDGFDCTASRTRHSQGDKEKTGPCDLDEGYKYDVQSDFGLALGEGDVLLASLPPEVSLFFYCELASLHIAIREDDFAAQLLWRARAHSDALPTGHPDEAVVWCGLGRVAFYAGCPDIGARTLSRARRIRERTIGGDTVETATTYNNLACCLSAMGRNVEAIAHLELATEILKILAGDSHPRAQVAVRNLEKVRTYPKNVIHEHPHLFKFAVHDPYRDLYKRRAKKKKKKGSTKSGKSSRRSSKARSSTSKSSKKSKGSKKSKSSSKGSKKKGKGKK